jgi:hypothetical protein
MELMSRLPLFLCLFLTTLLWIAEPALAKRLALVIGNSRYEHVPSLKNPANDAALMAASLGKVGFEVTLLKDQDQRAMKAALLAFGRKLKKGADAGLIYYAGHGIEVDGRNYLVPVDSNTQSEQEADISNIDLNDVMSLMENSNVPFNILILDACRNNPFRGFRSQRGGLAPVNAPVGTYIAYSTAPGTVAADGDGDNSPFTLALAEQLTTPGLTIESVFKNTRSAVRKSSEGSQVPFDSSAIEGDFFFKPLPAAKQPEVTQPEPVKVAPKTVAKPAPAEATAAPVEAPKPTVEDVKKARSAEAAAAWAALEMSDDTKAIANFAESYKDTAFAKLARDRLELLAGKAASLAPDDTPVEAALPPKVIPAPAVQSKDAEPKLVKPPRKTVAPAAKKPRVKKRIVRKVPAKRPVVKKAVTARKKTGPNCFTFDGQRVCD